ncbi:MAG: hypothetical protein BMS9Abin13_023 [Patescibacteria group bacterium]|nr:MAG: hypothetical protein BMS9Abin13_023 [Patescibacteria group bacterium]
MYTPTGGCCSALIHILFKHPILIVVFGISVGVGTLYGEIPDNDTCTVVVAELQKKAVQLEGDPNLKRLMRKAEITFQSLQREANVDMRLKTPAFRRVLEKTLGKITRCAAEKSVYVFGNMEKREQIAYFYFLDLLHRLGSVEKAAVEYRRISGYPVASSSHRRSE